MGDVYVYPKKGSPSEPTPEQPPNLDQNIDVEKYFDFVVRHGREFAQRLGGRLVNDRRRHKCLRGERSCFRQRAACGLWAGQGLRDKRIRFVVHPGGAE